MQIIAADYDREVELRVVDDGAGMPPERIAAVLAGTAGGIGLANVDRRLRTAFGEEYGLEIESQPGHGTSVVMTLPKGRAGVRVA